MYLDDSTRLGIPDDELFEENHLIMKAIDFFEDYTGNMPEYATVSITSEVIFTTNGLNNFNGSLTIPDSVTYLGTAYTITGIGDNAFADCTSLESIDIPESITSIGEGAFDGNYTTSITLNWTSDEIDDSDYLNIDPNWISNKSSSVIIHVSEELESTYYENREKLEIDGCTINGYTPEPTPEPSSNSNVKLAVGLGVRLGVPAVGGIGFGTYYWIKKKKNKK